jgi:hypothetical protein
MLKDQKLIAEAYKKISVNEQAQNAVPYTGPYEYVLWLADLDGFLERLRQATNRGMEFKTAHCALKQDFDKTHVGSDIDAEGNTKVYVFPKATDYTQVALIPTQYIG